MRSSNMRFFLNVETPATSFDCTNARVCDLPHKVGERASLFALVVVEEFIRPKVLKAGQSQHIASFCEAASEYMEAMTANSEFDLCSDVEAVFMDVLISVRFLHFVPQPQRVATSKHMDAMSVAFAPPDAEQPRLPFWHAS